ncbi:MAG: hypothetical protein KF819_24095 [Labilithrix sp.]|nr:hypothetical protein [Labilithrix sp.]
MRRVFWALALVTTLVAACGETRRPIGDECLRSDDCLSGVCSLRTCVAAPTLVTGAGGSPPDETPRIPPGDASAADAPADAPGDGG